MTCSGRFGVEKKRFVRTYRQGTLDVIEVFVDRETGVNYIFRTSGNAGGLTPLLGRDGKPVVTPILEEE